MSLAGNNYWVCRCNAAYWELVPLRLGNLETSFIILINLNFLQNEKIIILLSFDLSYDTFILL